LDEGIADTFVSVGVKNGAHTSVSISASDRVGGADLGGKGAACVTLTPDGQRAYVAMAVTNDVSMVDVGSLKEIARIPVGFVPKRNTTGMLPATSED
jgi:YVTN family beta-propeller protein